MLDDKRQRSRVEHVAFFERCVTYGDRDHGRAVCSLLDLAAAGYDPAGETFELLISNRAHIITQRIECWTMLAVPISAMATSSMGKTLLPMRSARAMPASRAA